MSERCEQTSERPSEWPNASVPMAVLNHCAVLQFEKPFCLPASACLSNHLPDEHFVRQIKILALHWGSTLDVKIIQLDPTIAHFKGLVQIMPYQNFHLANMKIAIEILLRTKICMLYWRGYVKSRCALARFHCTQYKYCIYTVYKTAIISNTQKRTFNNSILSNFALKT